MDLTAWITARVAWSPTYTYILLFFVAAAFVAFIARPRGRGEAVKRLYAGRLFFDEDLTPSEKSETGTRLHVRCVGAGKVVFRRLEVPYLTASGADSLAVTVKGKDVEILERVSAGYRDDPVAVGAEFELDLTGHEWRHVKWMDEESGLWCAFTLHVREGIDFTVKLRR